MKKIVVFFNHSGAAICPLDHLLLQCSSSRSGPALWPEKEGVQLIIIQVKISDGVVHSSYYILKSFQLFFQARLSSYLEPNYNDKVACKT